MSGSNKDEATVAGLKPKRIAWIVGLMGVSGAYYAFCGNLELFPLFKSYLMVAPLQVAALAYVLYWNWNKTSRSSPLRDSDRF